MTRLTCRCFPHKGFHGADCPMGGNAASPRYAGRPLTTLSASEALGVGLVRLRRDLLRLRDLHSSALGDAWVDAMLSDITADLEEVGRRVAPDFVCDLLSREEGSHG